VWTIKKTVYTLCITVLTQLVKDTGSGGSMFLQPEDVEKVRVGRLLSLVANTGLGIVL
jgi:hypothetical protein